MTVTDYRPRRFIAQLLRNQLAGKLRHFLSSHACKHNWEGGRLNRLAQEQMLVKATSCKCLIRRLRTFTLSVAPTATHTPFPSHSPGEFFLELSVVRWKEFHHKLDNDMLRP